jgi:hypothetical protein
MTTSRPIQLPSKHNEVVVLKGRAVAVGQDGFSPHEFGESREGTLQINVQLNIPELGRTFTSPLYFSPESAVYSFERLRALGKDDDDLSSLRGIDRNEVQVEFRGNEYNGKFGLKVQVMTGGGTFSVTRTLSPSEFAAKLKAVAGVGGPKLRNGEPEKPPF